MATFNDACERIFDLLLGDDGEAYMQGERFLKANAPELYNILNVPAAPQVMRTGDWILTHSGLRFWPLDPRPEEITLLDIAHSLSMQVRYNGHCQRFYSVAEHCCHLHDAAKPEDKAWALLHDATEAYLSDVTRPIKPYLTNYAELEGVVMAAIVKRFELGPEPVDIKDLDRRILVDEITQNTTRTDHDWEAAYGPPLGVQLRFWSPERARMEFMDRAAWSVPCVRGTGTGGRL